MADPRDAAIQAFLADSRDDAAFLRLGVLEQRRGNLLTAEYVFAELYRNRRRDCPLEALAGLFTLHYERAALARAAHYLRAMQAQAPAAPATRVAAALLDLKGGRMAEALAALQDLAAELPQDYDALAALGFALAQFGRTAEAVQALDRAVALDPARPEALRQLAALATKPSTGT